MYNDMYCTSTTKFDAFQECFHGSPTVNMYWDIIQYPDYKRCPDFRVSMHIIYMTLYLSSICYICYTHYRNLRNPWFAQRKVRICTLAIFAQSKNTSRKPRIGQIFLFVQTWNLCAQTLLW